MNDPSERKTQRLVVKFQRTGDNESFEWGVTGSIPALTLVGYIIRIQAELAFRKPDECEELALMIVWDEQRRECSWSVHPSIPVDPLVGMLEVIKTMVLGAHMTNQVSGGVGLLGPDGRPIRR